MARCKACLYVGLPDSSNMRGETVVLQCRRDVHEPGQAHTTGPQEIRWTGDWK